MRQLRSLEAASVAATVAIALFMRVARHFTTVFEPQAWVRFPAADPWYFARVAQDAAAHFPHVMTFDPLLEPGGGAVPVAQFFPWLAAAIAWIAALGHPSVMMVDVVAAWLPPVLGSATVLLMWFVARSMWGVPAGVLAALLTAIAPGELMRRAVLGSFDQHVAEVFFACAFLALVMPQLRTGYLRGRSVAAGVVLVAYLLSWSSGVLLLFVFFLCALVVVSLEWWANQESVALSVFATAFGVAAAVILPFAFAWPVAETSLLALLAALVVLGGAIFLQRFTQRRLLRFSGIAVAAVAGLAIAWMIDSDSVARSVANIHRLMPRVEATTVTEALPLMRIMQPAALVRDQFGMSAIVGTLGLALLLYRAVTRRQRSDIFLLLFSCLLIALFFAQVRFAYYAGVAAVLCSTLFVTFVLEQSKSRSQKAIVALVVVLVLVVPDATRAWNTPYGPPGPDREWVELLGWIRANTPDPHGGQQYTVATWWDYGYWVMHIAKRIPTSNPTQKGATETARIFLAQTESEAVERADRMHARYLISSPAILATARTKDTPVSESLIAPMSIWARVPLSKYIEVAEVREPAGRTLRVMLYHEAYYRALGVRLQLHGTGGAVAKESWVATLVSEPGAQHRRISAMRRFSTAAEAASYAAAEAGREIVGLDPSSTCVDLVPMTFASELRGGASGGPRLFALKAVGSTSPR